MLKRWLVFLEGGKSLFSAEGHLVRLAAKRHPFRSGMLIIVHETSKVEKQWLREMIEELSKAGA